MTANRLVTFSRSLSAVGWRRRAAAAVLAGALALVGGQKVAAKNCGTINQVRP